MHELESQWRITRVVDGDDHDVQLAQLQAVMERIYEALRHIPPAQRVYVGNALLNQAVKQILGADDAQQTATLLMRLSDAMHPYHVSTESSQAAPGALHG